MNAIACTSCGKDNPATARFCDRCGKPLPKSPTCCADGTLLPGTQLRDRYYIKRLLGRGGFSRTYLAEDRGRFGEPVTLKELMPANQGTYALQKAEELFQREAAMLHKLSSPQIPQFWEFFREGKRLFLVQDYVEGKTYQELLEERVAVGKRFSEAEIVQLFRQLLPVLSYLHAMGVIHRDIAPDNIIRRDSDGLPVLIDLGGVREITQEVVAPVTQGQGSTRYSGETRLGKIGYAPDEQLRLGVAGPHSDLYALGVTALVLMTGKPPQDLIDPLTLQWNWQQHLRLSPYLSSILKRMLASQPVERFQSADELLHQLDSRSTVAPTQLRSSTENNSAKVVCDSGQGHLFDRSVKVPEEIQGWNWGAFFLPGFWCLTNQVWLGLISWADLSLVTLPFTLGSTWLVMGIVLGIQGNEWAWKSRQWDSIKDFKRHQRLWAIAGFLVTGLTALLVMGIVLMVLAFGMSMGMGGMGIGD
jgi:serine/threonine-protein kinase